MLIPGSEFETSKVIYKEASHQMKKWSKIMYFVISKLTPIGLILPKSIITCSVYFANDSGCDVFLLPTPTW